MCGVIAIWFGGSRRRVLDDLPCVRARSADAVDDVASASVAEAFGRTSASARASGGTGGRSLLPGFLPCSRIYAPGGLILLTVMA
eukprot:5775961-Prymnesium_polylepis.1